MNKIWLVESIVDVNESSHYFIDSAIIDKIIVVGMSHSPNRFHPDEFREVLESGLSYFRRKVQSEKVPYRI